MPIPHTDKHTHAAVKKANLEPVLSLQVPSTIDITITVVWAYIYIMTDGNRSKHDSKTILLLAIPKTNTDFNI